MIQSVLSQISLVDLQVDRTCLSGRRRGVTYMSLPGNPLFLSRTSILTGKCWISGINMYVLVYPLPLTKVFPIDQLGRPNLRGNRRQKVLDILMNAKHISVMKSDHHTSSIYLEHILQGLTLTLAAVSGCRIFLFFQLQLLQFEIFN